MTAPQYVATRWDADSFTPGPGLPIVTRDGVLISDQGDLDAVRVAAGAQDVELLIQDRPFSPASDDTPVDAFPFVRYDGGQYLNPAQQEAAQEAIGVGDTVAADAAIPTFDLSTAPARSKRLWVADVLRNFRRGAPTEGWQLVDGAYVIPWDWYDPNNRLALGTKIRDLIQRQQLYLFTKTGRPAVAGVSPGFPADQQGLGLELMFPNLGEIKFQPDPNAYTDIPLPYKRPWLRLENGVHFRGNRGGTRLLSYMTATQVGIGTSYRPYPETPVRGDDLTAGHPNRGSSAPFTTADRTLYVSGGTGQVATGGAPIDTWRLRDTCRVVIDADVAANSYTCHVTADGQGGDDSSWYAARGLTQTARKLSNRLRVGCRVRRTQGQNPGDTHEVKYADLPMVVAIDGNTTPGFSKAGGQTVTFDRPFLLDVTIANEFTNFPIGKHNTAVYGYLPAGSGGVENIESHCLTVVEEPMLCTTPYLGDLTIVTDPTSPQKPTSGFAFQSCIRPLGENLGGFDCAQQIVDVNGSHDWVVRGLTHYGAVGTNVPNSGMAFDATSSRHGLVESLSIRGFPGPIAQAEAYSSFTVRGGRIVNDHPVPSTKQWFVNQGDSTIDLEGSWRFEGRGQLLWQRGSADVGPNGFRMRGRYTIVITDPAHGPRIRACDFEHDATIEYDGFNAAGTARVRRQFDTARWQDWQALPCKNGTSTLNLPLGLIQDGELRAPASLANVTSAKLKVAGCGPVNLLGVTATHLTSPGTDSVGDGVGSDADRTFTCDPANYADLAATDVGDTVRISAFNPDGSDWYSSVASQIVVAGVIQGFVTVDLPPAAVTSGTSVAIGDLVVPGKKIRLSAQSTSLWLSISAVTGLPVAASLNLVKLEQEDLGGRATLEVVYGAAPADPTDTWAIRCLTRQVAVRSGAVMNGAGAPSLVTGDTHGNAALAALLAEGVKRDFWRDGTTNDGGVVYAVRTTDSAAKNNDTTLTTSTVLVLTLPKGHTYLVEGLIWFDADAAADLKHGWSLIGAGASGKWTPDGMGSGIAGGALSGVIQRNQVDIASTAVVGGSGVGTVLATRPTAVVVTTTNDATLAFRYAQQTASATDLTIRALSMLRATPIL